MTETLECEMEYDLIGALFTGMAPDAVLTVSQWADEKRILPPTCAEPGPFKTNRTPYIREIADRLSVQDPAQVVIVQKSSQVAATEMGLNWLGYIMDLIPGPALCLMPTDAQMKKTSKSRLQPMIDSIPSLREKVFEQKSRDSKNTILEKYFPGGFIMMVGGNSPVGLSSTAVRFFYGDEIDRLPPDVGGEGSAIDLATTRTLTFGSRAKTLLTSTPTRKGQSAINEEFEKTCQCEYHVPCPHCGSMQALKFEQLKYNKPDYKTAAYECQDCKELIEEHNKTQMLAAGKWIPRHPERVDGVTWGYYINALYSPLGWYSWAKMAKEYEDSEVSILKRITFINTKLGICFEEEGEAPQWEILYSLREQYKPGTVKAEAAFITAGTDIQADRIEVEVVAWMKGKRSQSIDYRVIMGDTSQPDVWEKLELLLEEQYIRTDGAAMQIGIMAVDTGYNTSYGYDFCNRPKCAGRALPVKGYDQLTAIFAAPKPVQYSRHGKVVGSTKLYRVGVSHVKSELYGWLKLLRKEDGAYPPGYCHFPEYSSEYFRGLTAERLVRKTNAKNYNVFYWEKHYSRNEPLDCRVYARAAASIFGMDLFNDDYWDRLIRTAGPAAQVRKKERKKPQSGFWG